MKKGSYSTLWLYVMMTIGCLYMASCRRPQRLDLETQLTIPIFHEPDSFRISIEDMDYLRVGDDSILQVYFEVARESLNFSDSFNLHQRRGYTELSLRDFLITGVKPINIKFTLQEILPYSLPESTYYGPIDPFYNEIESYHDVGDVLDSIMLETGKIIISIHNYTEVPFDSIYFELGNPDNPQQLLLSYMYIGAHDSMLDTIYVENMKLSRYMQINASWESPGTDGQSVSISRDDSIIFRLKIDSLVATYIYGYATAFRLRNDRFVEITDLPFVVDSLHISKGCGGLKLESGWNIPFRCSLYVYEMARGFEFDFTPPVDSVRFDMDNTYLRTEGNRLHFYMELNIPEIPIAIDAASSTRLHVYFDTLNIDWLYGRIVEEIMEATSPETIELDLPTEMEHLNLCSSLLRLVFINTVGFDADLQIDVNAVGDEGELIRSYTGRIARGSPSQPDTSVIECDISDILNFRPHEVIVGARVGLPPQGGAIWYDSWVKLYGESIAPLTVVLTAPDTLFMDTTYAEMGIEGVDQITAVEAVVSIENRFPIELHSTIRLDSLDIEVHIPAAPTDERGVAVMPVDTTIRMEFTDERLAMLQQILRQDSVMVIPVVYVPATDTITVTANDYIGYRYAYLVLRVRLKEELK